MNKHLPLKDGDDIRTSRGEEMVMGEIKPKHEIPGGVCWTLQGNWYRRVDGEPMTADNAEVITVQEWMRRRRVRVESGIGGA